MKNHKHFYVLPLMVFAIAAFSFLNFTPIAQASITPALSPSATGDGDSVQIVVNGDANASVILYYTRINVGSEIAYIGTTNSSGYLSTVVSSSSYGIASYGAVHVTLGGISGISSPEASWPYITSTSTTTTTAISLSQTGLVLSVGSSSTITVNNSSSLYLSNNSNPSIANISLSGSTITVTANAEGSTVATVCVVGDSSNCASVYITVQASGTTALTFSVNNLTIANGNSASITISGGTGYYYVLSNSNSSIITTSINLSVITLTVNATSGSSSITVCSTNMTSCGIINATASSTVSSYISFSNTSPTISVGESTTVTVSGSSGGTYYISNNSNSGIVQATISDSTLNFYGLVNGTSIITVCSSLGSCGSATVTVSYSSSGGKLALSQTSLSLLVGQAVSVTISGGTTPYSLLASSDSIYQASINNNVLTVYGISSGLSTVWVCSSEGGCTSLSVTVNSSTSATTSQPYFSQNNISLNAGSSTTISIYGTGIFFIYNNSNSSVASATINGSTVIIYALSAGSTNVSICQGSSSYCSVLYITVVSTSSSSTATTTSNSSVSYFALSRYLGKGDSGDDVLQLQNALVKLGFLSATPTGYYGSATTTAVKNFQKNYSIKQTGNVGPSTKSALESLKISLTNDSSSTSTEDKIAELQALITSLTAQIIALSQ